MFKEGALHSSAWRLIKKEDSASVNGREYFWCIGDHYSGDEKYNGMYADHKSCDHDSWRQTIDRKRANCHLSGKSSNGATAADHKSATTQEKKLTLNDKLRNAFCTQAGLSAEAVDRIWEDAQGKD